MALAGAAIEWFNILNSAGMRGTDAASSEIKALISTNKKS